MTVSILTNREEFMGSDSQDLFNISFPIVEAADVRVVVEGPAPDYTKYLLALNTDYQIVNINYVGTFRVQLVNAAQVWLDVDGDLATGYKMCVMRGSVSKQPSDIRNLDRTHLDNVENQFDRLAYILQTHDEKLDRAIVLPETETGTLFTREVIRSTERAGGYLSFDASGNVIVAPGITGGLLVQEASNVIAQRDGTNGQIFRVYKTYTDSANYERLALDCSTTTFQIASQAAGTGVGRQLRLSTINNQPIEFMISTQRKWRIITSPQTLEPGVDNSFDIGQLSTRVRSIYWGTQLLGPDGSTGSPSYAFSSSTNTGFLYAAANIVALSINGGENVRWDGANGRHVIPSTWAYMFSSTAASTGTPDVVLVRDAAAVLAVKNGTTAQAVRVYGTTTGPHYLSLLHNGSSGVVNTNGATNLYLGTNNSSYWMVTTSAHFHPNSDNAYDLGGASNRVRDIRFGAQALGANGSVGAPAYSFSASTTEGFYSEGAGALAFAIAGVRTVAIQANLMFMPSNSAEFALGSSVDVRITRDAAQTLALKNGTNAQSFRVYGTTTGPKYSYLSHDGSNGHLGVAASSGNLFVDTGHFYPNSDNGQDLGEGSTRWRNGIFGTGVRVGSNPATTYAFNSGYANGIAARNSGNSADVEIAQLLTVNAVVDIVRMGTGSGGCQFVARTKAGTPSTSDLPSGYWTVLRDTSGATTKIYYNNAGAIIASAAFA